jgi:hypothetical protein
METFPLWFGRLTVTAFFAIAFLQSAADKWLDRKGNLEFGEAGSAGAAAAAASGALRRLPGAA